MSEYRYQLDRTRGSSKKYACPNCKGKKSFRRYIDTWTGEEVDDECGICDHLNSCGYHLSPKEFFRLHPERRTAWQDRHAVPENWTKVGQTTKEPSSADGPSSSSLQPTVEKAFTIDRIWVETYLSCDSHFMRWLLGKVAPRFGFTEAQVMQMWQEYQLGADINGRVVFWQIDQAGNVRSGKFMQYDKEGHRKGNPNWMHTYLLDDGKLNEQTWELRQCLFGEHLLAAYPDRHVNLVESEKTACIASLFHPDELWLATGGCHLLNADKVQPLIGRHLTVYPDSGCFRKWFDILLPITGLHCNIISQLEKEPPNTDLADILMRSER